MKQVRQITDMMAELFSSPHTLVTGTVKAVNESELTIDVLPTRANEEDTLLIHDVLLNAISISNKGMIPIPAIDSHVVIGMLDGGGQWVMICASEVKKLYVTVDAVKLEITDNRVLLQAGDAKISLDGDAETTIKLNDGTFGGLVKVEALTNKIKALETDLNDLKTVFLTTWVITSPDGGAALKAAAATWAGQTLSLTERSEIENKKVNH